MRLLLSKLSYLVGLLPIVLALTISIIFYFYVSAEQLIAWVGVNNAYGLVFLLALLGGLTTFSGVPYHLVLVTLALGGLNPIVLGLTAATGVALGDTTSYFLGYSGSAYISRTWQRMFDRLHSVAIAHPRIFPVICFLYGALVPFSNDFIAITAGLMQYPYRKVIVPLCLGNIIFNVTLAFAASHATEILQSLLLW